MNKLDTLDSIFYRRILRIPDYQRGYAWGLQQLRDFWDDIINLPAGKKHYTGMLSIKELSDIETKNWQEEAWAISDFNACYIVDGQQRITTFVILLSCIINEVLSLPKNKDKKPEEIIFAKDKLSVIIEKFIVKQNPEYDKERIYKFGYENDGFSFSFLKQEIFGENLNIEIKHSFYTRKLIAAKDFFMRELKKVKNSNQDNYEEQLKRLYTKTTSDLLFIVQEISDDFDVNVAFETMNNRGLSLSNLEKLKNRLIYLITLYDNVDLPKTRYDSIRKKINDAWKEIYYQLGRNANDILSDDEFLQNHWRIYHHYSRSSKYDYVTEILGDRFTLKSVIAKGDKHLSPKDIENYIDDLSSMARYWFYTHNPFEWKSISKVEQDWLARLNRLGMAYFRPIIISAYLNEQSEETDRTLLLATIEKFIFLLFRCKTGFSSQFKINEYMADAKELKNNKISVTQLTVKINETLESSLKNMTSFSERIDKLFSNNDGFYSWEGLKYFLFEYETKLVNDYGNPKINAEDFFIKNEKDKFSVEHIFPQKHDTIYYWKNAYRFFDDKQKHFLCNTLGNLLPLSVSVNSTMQNYEYSLKKNGKSDGRRGYKNGSYSELEVYNHNDSSDDWTYADILKRGLKLLHFFELRWKISLGNNEDKIKLLHLEFLEDMDFSKEEIAPFENKYEVVKQAGSKIIRKEFWKKVNTDLKTLGYKNTFNEDSLPSGYQLWFPKIGKTQVQMYIDIQNNIEIYLYFGRIDIFDSIKENKKEIDLKFTQADWDITNAIYYRKIKLTTKYDCDYKNKSQWSELTKWIVDNALEIENYFKKLLDPYDSLASESDSIEEFLNRKNSVSQEMKDFYIMIQENLLSKHPETRIKYKKHYASFSTSQSYADINILTDSIQIHVKDTGIKSDIGHKLPDTYLWSLNYRLYVKSKDDLKEAYKLIEASYNLIQNNNN